MSYASGGNSDAAGIGSLVRPTIPYQLVTRGYEVWAVSNRGFTYSNVNEKDGDWSL